MKREHRYVVLKIEDLKGCLTHAEHLIVQVICDKVAKYRDDRGALSLDCVVVESDWPEYEPTWKAIERRVDGRSQ